MSGSPLSVIVLADGEGTGMKSLVLPDVLHGFAGRTMLGHVLSATAVLRARQTVVVVGRDHADKVTEHLAEIAPNVQIVVPHRQDGTGHELAPVLEAIAAAPPGIVVLAPADAPLLTGEALADLVARHEASAAAATSLTGEPSVPTDDGWVADEAAAGVYAFDQALLRMAVERLMADTGHAGQDLTEVVAVLAAAGHRIGASVVPTQMTTRVHDRVQLAAAHRAYNTRLLESHMRSGVTVIDPLTTWVGAEVTIEADATLWPSVDLHGRTHIGAGASIGPQVTLTDTTVGANARISRAVAVQSAIGAGVTIGPFAHLRPGTVLAEGVHIGTCVELKNSEIGEGTKIPHLTYVGDATIGAHCNIAAATTFVNYDGVRKHRTVIGSHVHTGADNTFVAPVKVGDGAYTAAGSVITRDVPAGAIGVARANQRNVAGWVARQRPGTAAAKAAARALEKDQGRD